MPSILLPLGSYTRQLYDRKAIPALNPPEHGYLLHKVFTSTHSLPLLQSSLTKLLLSNSALTEQPTHIQPNALNGPLTYQTYQHTFHCKIHP